MRSPGNRVLRLALSPKALAQRLALALTIAAALVLMILSRADNAAIERLRLGVTDAAAPVLAALSQPVAAVRRGVGNVNHLLYLQRDNQRLREENERLRRWQAAAREFERQNAAYRALLNTRSEPAVSFITARVIGDSGGPFVRTVLFGSGTRVGVQNGQALVTGKGLVGRVVAAGRRASRGLLLTDLNSRVPVVAESSRYRGVLSGDNTAQPKLAFLPANARIAVGERLVTSGDGGLFPPGIPVGIVASIGEGGVRVQPLVDWDRLEYVRVLRFDLPRLSAAGGRATAAGRP